MICPRSAILQNAAASSVDGSFFVTVSTAELTGPLGVTALMVAFGGAALDAWMGRARGWRLAGRGLAVVGALVIADIGYGALRLHQADARRAAAPKVRTGVVQANVGILEKWDPREFARLLDLHQQESAELARAGAQLMVWPESSDPYALPRAPQALAQDLPADDPRRVRRGFDTPLLFGAVTLFVMTIVVNMTATVVVRRSTLRTQGGV